MDLYDFKNDDHTLGPYLHTEAQPGDIITYWDESGTICYLSGKVINVESDGTIMCESKWESYGLFQHAYNNVPKNYGYQDTTVSYEQYLLNVKFYRYVQDQHQSVYTSVDVNQHLDYCEKCQRSEYESHDNRCITVSSSRHQYICRDCGYSRYDSHTSQYTEYSDQEHTVRCSDCGYTTFADHNLYLYERNDDDPSTIMCSDCGYIVDCAETVDYVNGGTSGHYVTCDSDCFELLEDHALVPTENYNSSSHTLECRYCDYTETVEHELYTYAIYGGDNGSTVKCRICDYSIDCDSDPEFDGEDSSGHYTTCCCGSNCFSFFEEHQYEYSSQGVGSHLAECNLCYYEGEFSHEWVDNGSELECVGCGETISYSQANGIGDLTDEELAVLVTVLPNDKVEMLIASLPEDQVERVTALLPSDDEHLSELIFSPRVARYAGFLR